MTATQEISHARWPSFQRARDLSKRDIRAQLVGVSTVLPLGEAAATPGLRAAPDRPTPCGPLIYCQFTEIFKKLVVADLQDHASPQCGRNQGRASARHLLASKGATCVGPVCLQKPSRTKSAISCGQYTMAFVMSRFQVSLWISWKGWIEARLWLCASHDRQEISDARSKRSYRAGRAQPGRPSTG